MKTYLSRALLLAGISLAATGCGNNIKSIELRCGMRKITYEDGKIEWDRYGSRTMMYTDVPENGRGLDFMTSENNQRQYSVCLGMNADDCALVMSAALNSFNSKNPETRLTGDITNLPFMVGEYKMLVDTFENCKEDKK